MRNEAFTDQTVGPEHEHGIISISVCKVENRSKLESSSFETPCNVGGREWLGERMAQRSDENARFYKYTVGGAEPGRRRCYKMHSSIRHQSSGCLELELSGRSGACAFKR